MADFLIRIIGLLLFLKLYLTVSGIIMHAGLELIRYLVICLFLCITIYVCTVVCKLVVKKFESFVFIKGPGVKYGLTLRIKEFNFLNYIQDHLCYMNVKLLSVNA